MKKIDNWLGIKRFMTEAVEVIAVTNTADVEVWGKVLPTINTRRLNINNKTIV